MGKSISNRGKVRNITAYFSIPYFLQLIKMLIMIIHRKDQSAWTEDLEQYCDHPRTHTLNLTQGSHIPGNNPYPNLHRSKRVTNYILTKNFNENRPH